MLFVVWGLVLMSVIVMELATFTGTEISELKHYQNDTEAYYLSKTAVNHAISLVLRRDVQAYQDEAGLIHYFLKEEPVREKLLESDQVFLQIVTDEEANIAKDLDDDDGEEHDIGRYTFIILDEQSKININRTNFKELEQILYVGAGMEMGEERSSVANSILDWIDAEEPEDSTRIGGAEDDYYMSLDPPYNARNDDIISLDEMLLIKGITPEILYGSSEEDGIPGIANLITTFGKTFNVTTSNKYVAQVKDQSYNEYEWENQFSELGLRPVKLPRIIRIIGEGRIPGSNVVHRVCAVVNIEVYRQISIEYWNDDYIETEYDNTFEERSEIEPKTKEYYKFSNFNW